MGNSTLSHRTDAVDSPGVKDWRLSLRFLKDYIVTLNLVLKLPLYTKRINSREKDVLMART